MDDMNVSESTLAWLWVIEAMASFKEVDPSLLRDVIEAAPELPDDLGKNTKEFVALRCLEGLFASQNEVASDVPSAQGSKVGFDLSASCEDVLQQILQETSVSNLRVSRLELARWDIHPFIRHKRTCMPKCALEQLKDAIFDGTHPYADFLREKGGLAFTSRDDRNVMNGGNHDSVTTSLRPNLNGADVQNMRAEVNPDPLILENGNKQLREKLHDRDILPSKRDRSGSVSKDIAVIHENCIGKNNSDDQHMNVKRVKQYASSDNQSIKQNPVVFHGREPLGDSSERVVPVTTGGHDLPESEMGTMEEDRVVENGCNECTVTKRSMQSNNDGFHKEVLEISCNSPVMPQVISGDKDHQCLSVDEAEGVSNHCTQSSGALQSVEQNTVSLHDKQPIEDSSQRDVQAIVEEGIVLEDNCNDCTVSNRSQQSNDDELHKNQPEIPYNDPVVLQDTTRDYLHQHLFVNGTEDVGEPCAEPSSAPFHETMNKISPKKSKHSCDEHDFQFQDPNSASCDRSQQNIIAGEAKEDTNNCGEAEMSSDSDGYHNDRIDVARKKHDFLSSQCTFSHDSLSVDWREQNLCMKCNEAGSLLVCTSNNCQVVVHEKCGGSLARFDNKGNFYCPFCAYSLAITEYLEAKKRSSLANKELAAFICMGSEHDPEESTKRLNKEKYCSTGENADEDVLGQNQETEHLGGGEENEGNQVELNVDEDNNHQCQNIRVDDQETEISALCNNNVSLECREKRTSITRGMLHVSAGEREGEERVVNECPSTRISEGQPNEVPGKSDNVSGENADVILVNQGNADVGIQPQVLKDQDINATKRQVYDFDVNSEGNSDNDDHESIISNYYIRVRKRENHSTYPATPQTRRKKVPWTVEEEQKLKEGVQKFSSERNTPWKKILESGDSVFMKDRTTVDLKDKWRNMCRGTPKGK